ncbi:hypothetical protein BO78DRAFT_188771 [Aspergillus sclerotiicarbonarius CBS 121057]|uniref:Uncharacterized protein n=1 Tax=Aspergillus sclerotiicarbonarius (strain CBS 121057 / IBT 28362) TaxID=1448318 RepID=A0A319EJI4_ASPSB|nr:hypothetical protein BO78DRAFT_188771 [Aspergillus sclerotiicarbonarius CBS 121057]
MLRQLIYCDAQPAFKMHSWTPEDLGRKKACGDDAGSSRFRNRYGRGRESTCCHGRPPRHTTPTTPMYDWQAALEWMSIPLLGPSFRSPMWNSTREIDYGQNGRVLRGPETWQDCWEMKLTMALCCRSPLQTVQHPGSTLNWPGMSKGNPPASRSLRCYRITAFSCLPPWRSRSALAAFC